MADEPICTSTVENSATLQKESKGTRWQRQDGGGDIMGDRIVTLELSFYFLEMGG
jgi:hypothetical protein